MEKALSRQQQELVIENYLKNLKHGKNVRLGKQNRKTINIIDHQEERFQERYSLLTSDQSYEKAYGSQGYGH